MKLSKLKDALGATLIRRDGLGVWLVPTVKRDAHTNFRRSCRQNTLRPPAIHRYAAHSPTTPGDTHLTVHRSIPPPPPASLTMSEPTTKKFGSGERTIPHHSEKAPKYYPSEDIAKPKTVRTNPSFYCALCTGGGWLAIEEAEGHICHIPHNAQNPPSGRN
jgi:hypothetical protein